MTRLVTTKNLILKIQNLIMNLESQPIKLNLDHPLFFAKPPLKTVQAHLFRQFHPLY